MQQIKIFKGIETDVAALERDVNAWLKTSKAQIIDIFGNIAPQTALLEGRTAATLGADRLTGRSFGASDVMIVIVHETG